MEKRSHDIGGIRSKVGISFLMSGFASLIGVISGIISAGFGIFLVTEGQVSRFLLAAIVVSGSAILLTAIFTFILSRRERGPSHLAKFKDDLAAAYLNALRQSKLNPANGGHP